MLLSRLVALLLFLSVTLGQRVYLSVNGNPVDLFAVAFVLSAGLLWGLDAVTFRPAKSYGSLGPTTIAPFFALFAILPLIGIALGWYEPTALYIWVVVAVPLGTLSLGRAARLHGLRIDRLVLWMIIVHGLYGLGQTLARVGIVPSNLWTVAARWDYAAQAALSDAYVIYGRSTGLFINANVFGLWSCGAVLAGAVLMRGWPRRVSVILGVLGVVGSQSRTAWIGLAILVVIALVRMLRSERLAMTGLIATIMLAPVLAILWMSGVVGQLAEANLLVRLASGFSALSGGGDDNLTARVDAWAIALDFVEKYPLGTFGPPQALFGSFIDNQYVSLLLQGGLLLVIAYLILLFSPLVLAKRQVRFAGALGVASILLAISSWTMLPVEIPSAVTPLWLIAAAALGSVARGQGVTKMSQGPSAESEYGWLAAPAGIPYGTEGNRR